MVVGVDYRLVGGVVAVDFLLPSKCRVCKFFNFLLLLCLYITNIILLQLMLFTVVAMGNEPDVHEQVSGQELGAASVPSWQDFIGGRLNLEIDETIDN